MTRPKPTLCARARTLRPALRAGLVPDADLVRHVGTCPRCRAALRVSGALCTTPDTANGGADYVLSVARVAAAARLAALLEELARACMVRRAAGPLIADTRRPREPSLVLREAKRLRQRLRAPDGRGLEVALPPCPPEPPFALAAARAFLLAAERVDGTTESRRLQLAACALLEGDEASAGRLCSEIVAAAGRRTERTQLERRARRVARDWGVPSERMLGLLRQPARAGVN